MDEDILEKDFIRKPIPTYQHYVDQFEELYRQSPLAKVIIKDVQPLLRKSEECKTSGNTPTSAGPFKVPLAPQVLTPSRGPAGMNIISPVAQMFQQMQKQGTAVKGKSLDSAARARTTDQSSASPAFTETSKIRVAGKENQRGRTDPKRPIDQTVAVDLNMPDEMTREEDVDGVENDFIVEESSVEGVKTDVVEKRRSTDGNLCSSTAAADLEKKKNAEDPEGKPVKEQKGRKLVEQTQPVVILKRTDVDAVLLKDSSKESNLSLNENPIASKKKETVINEWIVKWLGSNHKHISVEGHREEDPEGSFWHSTAIVHRVSNHLLETSSGSRYRLNGRMNKLLTIDQGFSQTFVKRFEKGFPSSWRELIAQESDRLNGKGNSTPTDSETTPLSTRGKKAALVSNTRTVKPKKQEATRQKTRKDAIPTNSRRKKGENSKARESENKTPVSRTNTANVVTPNSIHVEKVQKTQSGRKVIPPLQYWTGQRQRSIPFLDGATEILEGSRDYTPVSATSVRLTGSIDISERTKRKFVRLEESGQKKGQRRPMTSDNDPVERDINAENSHRDTDDTHTSKEENIAHIKRKTSNSSHSRTRKSNRSRSREKFSSDTDELSTAMENNGSTRRRDNDKSRHNAPKTQPSEECMSSQKGSCLVMRLETTVTSTDTERESTLPSGRRRSSRNCSRREQSDMVVESENGDTTSSKRTRSRKTQEAVKGLEERTSPRHQRSTLRSDGENPLSDIDQHKSVANAEVQKNQVKSGKTHSSKQQQLTKSGKRKDEEDQKVSKKQEQMTGDERNDCQPDKHSSRDVRASRNPYDLYGAVMNVVDKHRQRWQSVHKSRRLSQSRKTNQTPGLNASVGSRSYSISDDEDFINESSSPHGGRKLRSVDKGLSKSAEPLPSGSKPSSSDSNHWMDSSTHSVNHSQGAFIRKRKSSLEKSLLGSNMLPTETLVEEAPDDARKMENGKPKRTATEEQRQLEGRSPQKKHRSRASKKKTNTAPEKEADGEQWQPDELSLLQKALKTIPPSSPQFWLRVAGMVGTRTAWECQEAHQAGLEDIQPTAPRTRAANKSPKETVALTATKGTMRRKRQLKDFIQQHNQNADDDLFDSTPFKKQKMTTKALHNLGLEEETEEDDDFVTKTPGSARLKTPSTRLRTLLPPLSAKKTPHSGFLSPGLMNSVETQYMDQYIHFVQKKRPGGRRGIKRTPDPGPKAMGRRGRVETSPGNLNTSDIFRVDPAPELGEEDEEGEADYYWSDEDD